MVIRPVSAPRWRVPKLCDTNTIVSGAVTRKVAPNTSANTATDSADWSTITSANTATRAPNASAVGHTGPARSLRAPPAITPTRPVSPISASRLPARKHVDAAIFREGDDVGGDEKIVEAADRVDRRAAARTGACGRPRPRRRPRSAAPPWPAPASSWGSTQISNGTDRQIERRRATGRPSASRPPPGQPPARRSRRAGRRSCRTSPARWRCRRVRAARASP